MVDGGGTAAIASAIQTTFPSTPEGGEKGPDIFDTTKPRRPLFYDAATAPSIPSSTDMAAETNKTPLEAAALPQTSRQDVIAGVAFVDQTTPALATEGAFLEPNAPTKAIPDTLIPNISQEERGLSRNSSGAAQEVAEDGKKEISSTPTLKGEIGVSEKALSQESGHLRHLAAETSSPSSSSTSEKEEIAVVPNDQDEQNGHDGAPLKQTQSQADKMAKSRIVIIMLSLCMALFLAALDITIIATALPTIAQHFHASAANYTWVGSSYLLACSASVPLWGRLSDIWGRKPVILLANVIFMVGSLVAALSNSIGMLIGGRVIQGIGGGGLVILVNICVSDLFSMRERAKYFGVVGMVWAVAGAVGPVVGGAFTEKVSWRWCFYVNLPLDGLAFILLVFFLKLETPRTPFIAGIKSIDWLGVITIVGGVVMFLFGLESGGTTRPWNSAYTVCLIIFGLFTIGLFFLDQWKLAKYPIMPLRLFNNSSNLAALGVCFVHGMVFIAGTYYLPLYFQTVLSATPILSGVYLFPLAISLAFFSAVTGLFIKKTGLYREPIWFGLVLMTLGFGLFINLKSYASWPRIIIFQIIAGVGIGPNFQSPLLALQNQIHPGDIATATSLFGFVRQLATAISIVLGEVVFSNELNKHRAQIAAAVGPRAAQGFSGSSFGAATGLVKSLPPAQKAVINQAYTDALQKMWIFYTAISGFGIFIALLIKKKELSQQHQKTVTGLVEQERLRKEREVEERAKKALKDGKLPTAGEKSYEDV